MRVVALLLFAAVAGAFLGARGWPGVKPFALLLVTGALAAMGSSALNEYLEQESDARMVRTQDRPLVVGAFTRPAWVPIVGAGFIVVPALAVLTFNPALTLFLVLGAVIYLGVYTLWLKPRTPLNVVVGGLAGSCAVLSGGAVVDAWTDPGVLTLAALIFLWSPTHFWSLALACHEDYRRAGIPMLPIVVSPRSAAFWSVLHAVAGCAAGLLLIGHPDLGAHYALPALGAAGYLLLQGGRLLYHPTRKQAWRLFHASNFYLGLILLAICVDALLNLP